MPPMSDRMHGTFTLAKEGELVFSEAMILVEADNSVEALQLWSLPSCCP